jgi:hypothetical protein
MPNVNQVPRPGDRTAVVIGHFFPRTFAWQIKTGRLVNRPALRDAVLALDATDLRAAVARAAGLAAVNTFDSMLQNPKKFQRITAAALQKGYANDCRDLKGARRQATEKMLIRAILEIAAARLRASQPAV